MKLQENVGRDGFELVAAVVLQPTGSDGVRAIANQASFNGTALAGRWCQATDDKFRDGSFSVSHFDGMPIGTDSQGGDHAAGCEPCFANDIKEFRVHGSLKHPQHHIGGIRANVRHRHGLRACKTQQLSGPQRD
jgi:hypothetical protein